jgi:hypothetical protein
MLFKVEELSHNSRVWIYQANRKLTADEIQYLEEFLGREMEEWSAHGAALKAGFEIRYNQIIALFADEGQHAASGCSIDSSTRWFKDLGQKMMIDFFDRSIAIVQNDTLQLFPMLAGKKEVESGNIQSDSLVATPQVPNLDFYQKQWPELAKNSWLKKYFQSVNA